MKLKKITLSFILFAVYISSCKKEVETITPLTPPDMKPLIETKTASNQRQIYCDDETNDVLRVVVRTLATAHPEQLFFDKLYAKASASDNFTVPLNEMLNELSSDGTPYRDVLKSDMRREYIANFNEPVSEAEVTDKLLARMVHNGKLYSVNLYLPDITGTDKTKQPLFAPLIGGSPAGINGYEIITGQTGQIRPFTITPALTTERPVIIAEPGGVIGNAGTATESSRPCPNTGPGGGTSSGTTNGHSANGNTQALRTGIAFSLSDYYYEDVDFNNSWGTFDYPDINVQFKSMKLKKWYEQGDNKVEIAYGARLFNMTLAYQSQTNDNKKSVLDMGQSNDYLDLGRVDYDYIFRDFSIPGESAYLIDYWRKYHSHLWLFVYERDWWASKKKVISPYIFIDKEYDANTIEYKAKFADEWYCNTYLQYGQFYYLFVNDLLTFSNDRIEITFKRTR